MRHFLKALLPKKFLNLAVGARDRLYLASLPSLSRSGQPPRFNTGKLAEVFADKVIASVWEKDHASIKKFYVINLGE
jgi:hypothetical protein